MIPVKALIKKWKTAPKPETVARFDNEVHFSRYIPMTHLVSPRVFMTKNGELGAVVRVDGNSFAVQDNQELALFQSQLAFFIKSLGEQYGIYVTAHRYLKPTHLTGDYPAGFVNEFQAAYHQQFVTAKLYVTDLYVTLLCRRPQAERKKTSIIQTVKNFLEAAAKTEFTVWFDKQLREFDATLHQLKTALSAYTPHILSEKKGVNGKAYPELMRFFSILVNGEARDFDYPWMDIAQAVPYKRLFANNDTLHFQGNTPKDDVFGAILSIRDYSYDTYPGKLDELLKLSCSFVLTHTFLGIAKEEAITMITEKSNRLQSTLDSALSQISELEQAKDDVASTHISFGFHHNTILVLSSSLADLGEQVSRVTDIYSHERIVAIRETLNLENAFFAQIPGNARFIRRAAAISSHNFTCFAPLHNYYTGHYDQNHLGSALLLAETPSKTPFYLNLHERASGRKGDLSKGHTLLIGPPGAGKTVIMTTIDAMMQKYAIRSFIFDRDYGMEIYVCAMKGRYYRLTPDEPTGFNPCQLPDTSKNRDFLTNLLCLLSTDATEALSADDLRQIADVVSRNYTLPFEKRSLSNISFFFGCDFKGLSALSRWLAVPDSMGRSGEFAWVFDNAVDTFSVDTISTFGFDMTYLLGCKQENRDQLLPVMYYLFHKIESTVGQKRLTGVYLDEGWQTLNHPYFVEKIATYLATWRKANAFLFFATQLPETVADSALAAALNTNTATHIYLANPLADATVYIEKLKLTRREFEIISTLDTQSRYFLIKQSRDAAVVRISLNGLEKYIRVLSGNLDSVQECREIIQQTGDDPDKWLPLFYSAATA